jgi:hypothetical protein
MATIHDLRILNLSENLLGSFSRVTGDYKRFAVE